jgi:hypothetical protein
MAKGTWTVVAFTFVTLISIFPIETDAQQIVTPNKVTSEAVLDQVNADNVRCGIHWVNFVTQSDNILAYQINIEAWFLPETQQSTTVVWASLRTTNLKDGQTSHVDTPPTDIYLFIQQDPTTYRITPAPGAFSSNWFGGAIDAGGIKGDSGKALAPTLAMQKGVPMLVYLVFDSPSGTKKTLAFNAVNNLPSDQNVALSDCLVRGVKRAPP